ncbi:DUF1330 domain-containing protein [Marinomonas sp. 2405UD66-6]|uniref:DUF1330 domain-containing protein n=1 Tax=Marinomonas sp. 2405UD66-6 TaxID=3391834 RepID=UPI0039C97D22
MTSLVIVDLTPINKEKMAEYSAQAAETLKPFAGHFIAKGAFDVLHGDTAHSVKAIIQFPDQKSAKDWYNSDAYQAILPLRDEGMSSQFHLIELLA